MGGRLSSHQASAKAALDRRETHGARGAGSDGRRSHGGDCGRTERRVPRSIDRPRRGRENGRAHGQGAGGARREVIPSTSHAPAPAGVFFCVPSNSVPFNSTLTNGMQTNSTPSNSGPYTCHSHTMPLAYRVRARPHIIIEMGGMEIPCPRVRAKPSTPRTGSRWGVRSHSPNARTFWV